MLKVDVVLFTGLVLESDGVLSLVLVEDTEVDLSFVLVLDVFVVEILKVLDPVEDAAFTDDGDGVLFAVDIDNDVVFTGVIGVVVFEKGGEEVFLNDVAEELLLGAWVLFVKDIDDNRLLFAEDINDDDGVLLAEDIDADDVFIDAVGIVLLEKGEEDVPLTDVVEELFLGAAVLFAEDINDVVIFTGVVGVEL